MKTIDSKQNQELLARTEAYVLEFFAKMDRQLIYHNLEHTHDVVNAANRIADTCGIPEDDRTNLLIAAWFHDTGYGNSLVEHEVESVRIMKQVLSGYDIPAARIAQIERIILSTRIPHNPTNLLEKIICDADMIHLADTEEYQNYSERLRMELNNTCAKNINKEQWLEMNVEFLSSHCYFTEYGKKFLRPKKFRILKRIKTRIQSLAGM